MLAPGPPFPTTHPPTPEVQRNLVPAAVNPDVMIFLPTLFDVLELAAVFGQTCKSSPWGCRRKEAPGCESSRWTLALSGSEFLGKSVVLELWIHSSALRHCLWKPWDKVKVGRGEAWSLGFSRGISSMRGRLCVEERE
uniref:uncharacterized protein LOC712182 isoform X6 n=1 Tax=Macaca mulatta TaxID=9544 RepID=UPI0010A27544|nr:uncharacterized protein LOC712182 isoform X6 [Macaca mulatta]